MKIIVLHLLRSVIVLIKLLAVVAPLHAAIHNDNAAQILATTGSVPVRAAGPYVEVGTFRVQVATKLGEPDAKLADGTWLYDRRRIEDSAAIGTLVVRFERGRVSSLTLAGPRVVAALQGNPKKNMPAFSAAE